MGRSVGVCLAAREPRNAFQANVCIRGLLLGSSLSASLRTKADPEFASSDRAWFWGLPSEDDAGTIPLGGGSCAPEPEGAISVGLLLIDDVFPWFRSFRTARFFPW